MSSAQQSIGDVATIDARPGLVACFEALGSGGIRASCQHAAQLLGTLAEGGPLVRVQGEAGFTQSLHQEGNMITDVQQITMTNES